VGVAGNDVVSVEVYLKEIQVDAICREGHEACDRHIRGDSLARGVPKGQGPESRQCHRELGND